MPAAAAAEREGRLAEDHKRDCWCREGTVVSSERITRTEKRKARTGIREREEMGR